MFKVDYAVIYNVNLYDDKVAIWYEEEKPFINEETGIIAYKISLGWYTFYITEELLKVGIAEKVIEEPKGLDTFSFSIYRVLFGISSSYRLSYSLKKSSLEKLKEVVVEFEHCPKIWTVKQSKCKWYKDNEKVDTPICEEVATVIIDIDKRVILDKLVFKKDIADITLADVKNYDEVIAHLIKQIHVDYMNTENLMKRFEDNDFYSIDRFFQRRFKYNFTPDFFLSTEEQIKSQEEYPDEIKAELKR